MRLTMSIGLALVLISGCYSPSMYSGEGTMSSPVQGVYRYRIDLGGVDLTRALSKTYTLSGMPHDRFIIGLEAVRKQKSSSRVAAEPPLRARVRMQLTNERNEIVVEEQGPLTEWVWTAGRGGPYDHAFIYRRGKDVEIPLATGGGVRVVEGGKRVVEGWGTYFMPRREGRYVLSLEVLSPDPESMNFEVRMVVFGGEKSSL